MAKASHMHNAAVPAINLEDNCDYQNNYNFVHQDFFRSDNHDFVHIASPFAGIQKAVDTATPGCTIYIRGGTYKPSKNIQVGKSGTASQRYIVAAYPGEKVIIDGDNMTGTPAALDASLNNPDRGIFHIQNANYWTFKSLETPPRLINGPYGIYNRDASYNDFLDLITHDNYESGFQLEGNVAYCNVINLDSYMNRDPRKNGESADGLAIKQGRGAGNVVRGCRLWNNVDDGLDLWMFETPILIENTIAWGNGVNRWGFSPFEGDGNGFKLGGGDPDVPANHIVRNCFAFRNAVDGFTDNGNYGTLTLDHNTSWKNNGTGFDFADSPKKAWFETMYGLTGIRRGFAWAAFACTGVSAMQTMAFIGVRPLNQHLGLGDYYATFEAEGQSVVVHDKSMVGMDSVGRRTWSVTASPTMLGTVVIKSIWIDVTEPQDIKTMYTAEEYNNAGFKIEKNPHPVQFDTDFVTQSIILPPAEHIERTALGPWAPPKFYMCVSKKNYDYWVEDARDDGKPNPTRWGFSGATLNLDNLQPDSYCEAVEVFLLAYPEPTDKKLKHE
ncbi:hypothetical protein Dda_4293 [Drechslerella dactyloides]|uniref:Pel9A-like right handed beta-helix region domain-containing protein n=1 Tax=Drechslerella dactyloides TaxID=74499 RepID=A0AAD6NLX0_DREDA|nr:hypothetical protein Dda_4293 [Drechslerella dactyloides]